MGDEPLRPVDLAEEEGCYQTLLLVRVEAAVLAAEAAVDPLALWWQSWSTFRRRALATVLGLQARFFTHLLQGERALSSTKDFSLIKGLSPLREHLLRTRPGKFFG